MLDVSEMASLSDGLVSHIVLGFSLILKKNIFALGAEENNIIKSDCLVQGKVE